MQKARFNHSPDLCLQEGRDEPGLDRSYNDSSDNHIAVNNLARFPGEFNDS